MPLRKFVLLRGNEKERSSMQRAAGQQGDKVTSSNTMCLLLHHLRDSRGAEKRISCVTSCKYLTATD